MYGSKIIKALLSVILVGIIMTGCGSDESIETSATKLTGEDYILSLVNCDDAYISRGFGDYKGHTGVDIAAPEGVEIYAADSGTVHKTVTMNMGYGYHIIIDHGDYQTLYAHCSSFADIEAGDTVEKGDVVAYVGNTGNSTGAHLHFEVITADGQQNPIKWYK